MKKTALSLFIFWMLLIGITSAQEPPARVTILYDALGKPSTLKRGWGYSALVEYGGKRVLFNSGGGLKYVLSLNPGVKIYTPVDTAVFGGGGRLPGNALGKLI
jgi:7,8-dihydropterin-6-yl-methyl-4-(beta-D-ribofuranosyl)aminobenzene 5'-phosphate synthase